MVMERRRCRNSSREGCTSWNRFLVWWLSDRRGRQILVVQLIREHIHISKSFESPCFKYYARHVLHLYTDNIGLNYEINLVAINWGISGARTFSCAYRRILSTRCSKKLTLMLKYDICVIHRPVLQKTFWHVAVGKAQVCQVTVIT